MKSARDVAIELADPDDAGPNIGDVAEAIQQAREDGARWMVERLLEFYDGPDERMTIVASDVRGVAP